MDTGTGNENPQDIGAAGRGQVVPRQVPAIETFVVEPTHIDAILSVALHGPSDFDARRYPGWDRPDVGELVGRTGQRLSVENATEVGVELLSGCVASVIHQRALVTGDGDQAVVVTPDPHDYEFEDLGPVLTVAESCKALACLECQSGEDPHWPESAARAFCGALLWRVISALPGYESAPWEFSAEVLLDRAGARAA
jgi:hypothetical protein